MCVSSPPAWFKLTSSEETSLEIKLQVWRVYREMLIKGPNCHKDTWAVYFLNHKRGLVSTAGYQKLLCIGEMSCFQGVWIGLKLQPRMNRVKGIKERNWNGPESDWRIPSLVRLESQLNLSVKITLPSVPNELSRKRHRNTYNDRPWGPHQAY